MSGEPCAAGELNSAGRFDLCPAKSGELSSEIRA